MIDFIFGLPMNHSPIIRCHFEGKVYSWESLCFRNLCFFFFFQISRHAALKELEEIRVSASCLKQRKAIRGDMGSEGESR